MPKDLLKPFCEHLQKKGWIVEKEEKQFRVGNNKGIHSSILRKKHEIIIQRIFQLNENARNNISEFLKVLEPVEIQSSILVYYMEDKTAFRAECVIGTNYTMKEFDLVLKNAEKDFKRIKMSKELAKYLQPENKPLEIIRTI